MGGPGYGVRYAEWPKRALSNVIDYVGPYLVALIFFRISSALGFILWLGALGWSLYNYYLMGQTGQSYGKKQAGTKLVRESDGQVIGGGMGILRFFVHIVDAIPCYIGFLWPIWDQKKQTFADKILGTIVIEA